MRLEVVVIPVSDVDRSRAFYETAGFRVDLDLDSVDGSRLVRLTPPGSAASIVIGRGVSSAIPGSAQGLHLVVSDIVAAVAALRERGVEVTDPFHDIGGTFHHESPAFELPGPDPARRDHASFARFSDPDGNGWVLEEVGAAQPDDRRTV